MRYFEFLKEYSKDQIVVPTGDVNIEREDMPQIKSNLVRDFLQYLKDDGVHWKKKKIASNNLRPTQQDFNLEKVTNLMDKDEDQLSKPIIISNDNYVLDGHHRWLALLNKYPERKIEAYFIDLPITELLDKAHDFEGTTYKDITESKSTS